MTDKITHALHIATIVHADQKDKGGQPYILHIIRVMNAVLEQSTVIPLILARRVIGEDCICAAILHDVVEDGGISPEVIQRQFGQFVADIVDTLTRRGCESYGQYIDRVSCNRWAAIIKRCDVRDNLLEWRLAELDQGVAALLRTKYARALDQLAEM